jgi:uncharacterized protein YqeY
MSLADTVANEMKTAMRAKDKVTLETLRAIKSAILLAKTEKGGSDEMSEADELKLLMKLQKQRKDSLEIYEQQKREDLAAEERGQLEVIERFLPKQMDQAELDEHLKGLIERLNVQGPKDMGKLMGAASKELAGKADGKTIAARVKELLK